LYQRNRFIVELIYGLYVTPLLMGNIQKFMVALCGTKNQKTTRRGPPDPLIKDSLSDKCLFHLWCSITYRVRFCAGSAGPKTKIDTRGALWESCSTRQAKIVLDHRRSSQNDKFEYEKKAILEVICSVRFSPWHNNKHR
jgi:hypothetical protein